jgi:hypothetical protein
VKLMELLKGKSSADARRGARDKSPLLVAYFWDGGDPVAHKVKNVSSSGFYLDTTERWLLGTLVMMTLQRTSPDPNRPECSVIVMSKVIHHGEDGVGFAFVPVESSGAPAGPGSNAADRRTLDKFLHLVKSDGKH